MRDNLTQTKVMRMFHYDPLSGTFTRKTNCRGRYGRIGDVAGHPDNKGYLLIQIGAYKYKVHRLAWLYMHGIWPIGVIDHINHVVSDNRISNLRDVTPDQNREHVISARRCSVTKLLGAHYIARSGKYVARIGIKGKQVHIGTFDTAEAAHEAYIQVKRMHHLTTL